MTQWDRCLCKSILVRWLVGGMVGVKLIWDNGKRNTKTENGKGKFETGNKKCWKLSNCTLFYCSMVGNVLVKIWKCFEVGFSVI